MNHSSLGSSNYARSALVHARADVEQETTALAIVREQLVAVRPGGVDPFDFDRRAPVAGAGGAGVRPKADQGGALAEPLAAELADIELPAHRTHLGL
jgi:hypothetical protein